MEVKLYRAREGQKDFTGSLTQHDKDTVTIELEDKSTMTFGRQEIALIRLALDF